MAPPTDLSQLTTLLGNASLVIGGDTGPVHLAASLGTPTVAVFLTTDWRRNGPRGRATVAVSGASLPPQVVPRSARARQGRSPGADEIVAAAARLLSEASPTNGTGAGKFG
jgi:heptosyltransferase-1